MSIIASPELIVLRDRLRGWLVGEAYPRWAAAGIEPSSGGFVESLGQDGRPPAVPRRARVPPRQVYAFAHAARLGWDVDPQPLMAAAFADYRHRYGRADGLYRTLLTAAGEIADDTVLLYDHAFVLLALAEQKRLEPAESSFEVEAVALRARLEDVLRAPGGGFLSSPGAVAWREANPHMHFLEACLAWVDVGGDDHWRTLATEIAGLARTHFIQGPHGALYEVCDADWRPVQDLPGRVIEPGHQFEWAWLLLREAGTGDAATVRAALGLIAVGEELGVHDGYAVMGVLGDGTLHDPVARLWSQTERLKAALAAFAATGDRAFLGRALAAGAAIESYLHTPLSGLWFDVRRPDGRIADGPAPASTFYHLVCAIDCLDRAVGRSVPGD
jgi:mannose/cellobiose epimerase-like protein (N-acyl-D-glucosamine 2-epimerase family)